MHAPVRALLLNTTFTKSHGKHVAGVSNSHRKTRKKTDLVVGCILVPVHGDACACQRALAARRAAGDRRRQTRRSQRPQPVGAGAVVTEALAALWQLAAPHLAGLWAQSVARNTSAKEWQNPAKESAKEWQSPAKESAKEWQNPDQSLASTRDGPTSSSA